MTLFTAGSAQVGTDPRDAQSYLKLGRIDSAVGATAVILSFIARSNHSYSVQSREQLGSGTWQRVLDVVASSADRIVTATNTVQANQSYFRLVTPKVD